MHPDCLEQLIATLTDMGIGVYEEEGFLFFSREQNRTAAGTTDTPIAARKDQQKY